MVFQQMDTLCIQRVGQFCPLKNYASQGTLDVCGHCSRAEVLRSEMRKVVPVFEVPITLADLQAAVNTADKSSRAHGQKEPVELLLVSRLLVMSVRHGDIST